MSLKTDVERLIELERGRLPKLAEETGIPVRWLQKLSSAPSDNTVLDRYETLQAYFHRKYSAGVIAE